MSIHDDIREANDLYLQLVGVNNVVRGDAKMTDFKVGDVVRFKPKQTNPGAEMRAGRAYRVDDIDGEGMLHLEGDLPTTTWWPMRFELVSRPPNDEEARQYLARSDSPLDRKIAAGMGLKVGDRVRILSSPSAPRGWERMAGTIEELKSSACLVYVGPGSRVWCHLGDVELLPPKPAALSAEEMLNKEVNHVIGPFMRAMAERLPDELNAAELSIQRQDQMDAMRYMLTPVLTVKPGVLKAMYPESIQPGQVIVYDEEPTIDESGPGIAKLNLPKPPTKHRERLMTTSWAPYADWDNLPDAD